ncbi:Hypothetical protein Minf_0461 [Methylacidiphilum infernorum V4]|uniref:Uncharacterized protein n=1 Tax=Methylacidiphilum infernorum (isolate V4) TaxID=481448 RepID=B3DYZ7_METI4|nr:Hypothetical protein Minf_0461 [Methylacidiphilum infernorum V4]
MLWPGIIKKEEEDECRLCFCRKISRSGMARREFECPWSRYPDRGK